MAKPVGANFLGTGFPFPLGRREDGIAPARGEEKIRQSIYVILMTRQGERTLNPAFGSRIWDYVFEITNATYLNLMCAEVVRAVSQWEHRISNVQAQVDTGARGEGKLMVSVTYTVRATNRPDNLVFPFYIEEGRW